MLKEKIIEKIGRNGPVSFHDFMEMALYDPAHGYYMRETDCIGPGGDFYTSAYLTSMFGILIARQIEEMWQLLGGREFTIVEYGAGTGLLCSDILGYLQNNEALYRELTYCIIERSQGMRARQRVVLQEKVRWIDQIDDLSSFHGCVLSNELVDNFSVHQVVMKEELSEIYVDYDGDFKEVLKPATAELKNYFRELNVCLGTGCRAEINLQAINWIKEIASVLDRGFVITIDYGFSSADLYSPSRRNGTLKCYHQHTSSDNPYRNIGSQDITTHINFSALCHWGLQNGLLCCGLTSQAQFLLSLGIEEYLSGYLQTDPARYRFLKQKLLLEMGTRFKVLVQRKNINVHALSAFRL